jgi:hypothetical protein
MECELPMLVYIVPNVSKAQVDRVSEVGRFLSMPERLAARKLGFAEVFARVQVGAVHKLRR